MPPSLPRFSSISTRLKVAVCIFVTLLLLQFIGTFLANQRVISGLSGVHNRQRLTEAIERLRRTTDSLAAIPGERGVRAAEAQRLFELVHAQAERELSDAASIELGPSPPGAALAAISGSLADLKDSAGDYYRARSGIEAQRALLKTREYAIDLAEAEDRLQLATEQESNRIFESVYRLRYRPVTVAFLLALLFVALTLPAGLGIIHGIAESIANLMAATRAVAQGDLKLQAPMLSRDEIGALTLDFNTMIRELRESTVSREHFATLAAENSRLYHEAQEAVRARDEFLSIASHELRTPLTPLLLQLQGLVRQLKRRGEAGPEQEAFLKMLILSEAQGRKLASLLDDLLDLTRIRLGQLKLTREPTDLDALVREAAGRFRAEAAQRGISIAIHSGGALVGRWDPMRIEQLAGNLISNAIKYGNGTPITIDIGPQRPTAGADHPTAMAAATTMEAATGARLAVSDQGAGIAPEMLSRIFERFERGGISGRKISGLGLGLYICRQIAEAHGGTIRVESQPGRGSSFIVELPLKEEADATRAA